VQAVPEIRAYLERIAEDRVLETFRRTSVIDARVQVSDDDEEVEVLI
jgi:hypothetical protein